MKKGSLLVAMVLAMVFSCQAQEQMFPWPTHLKGTQDAEVWGGTVIAQHDGSTTFDTNIFMGGVRYGRILTAPHGRGWLRGTLEWNFGLVPVFVFARPQAAFGVEVDPIELRWNLTRAGNAAPYFLMAGGIAVTNTNVPPGDTSAFNVVPKIGLGWQIFTRPQRSFDASLCAWHLSNAWTGPRNPSINGLQLTFGYHWFKPNQNRQAGTRGSRKNNGGNSP